MELPQPSPNHAIQRAVQCELQLALACFYNYHGSKKVTFLLEIITIFLDQDLLVRKYVFKSIYFRQKFKVIFPSISSKNLEFTKFHSPNIFVPTILCTYVTTHLILQHLRPWVKQSKVRVYCSGLQREYKFFRISSDTYCMRRGQQHYSEKMSSFGIKI